jgi:hypothetical protein
MPSGFGILDEAADRDVYVAQLQNLEATCQRRKAAFVGAKVFVSC